MQNFKIQFKIVFTSLDIGGNNEKNTSFLIYTFPLKFNHQLLSYNSEFQRVLEVLRTDGSDYFSTDRVVLDDVMAFDDIVYISAKLSSANGNKVIIYSTKGFEIEPGAEISPEIELVIGYPFQYRPQSETTFTQVSAFCADNNKYKAKEFTATAIKMEQEEYARREEVRKEALMRQNQLHFQLFPNPTNDVVNIRFDAGITENVQVEVVDITGKTVYTTVLNKGEQSYPLSLGHLVKGMYFVHLYKGEVKAAKKLVLH